MNITAQLFDLTTKNYLTLIISIGLLILFIILRRVLLKLVQIQSGKNHIAQDRERFILKLTRILLWLVFIIAMGAVWEISLKGLSLYFASIFTVVGVALFANWSLLSNLTASIILFFFFPIKIGHSIKILDGDNTVEGIIIDISLFYFKIESERGIALIPNNVILQKVVWQDKED
ncbi:MAG: mechanosensitive ion channel [Cyclobacteriaceae bacterium]